MDQRMTADDLTASVRPAGRRWRHVAYHGDDVIGRRVSEHRYAWAIVARGGGGGWRVVRWSASAACVGDQLAVRVEDADA